LSQLYSPKNLIFTAAITSLLIVLDQICGVFKNDDLRAFASAEICGLYLFQSSIGNNTQNCYAAFMLLLLTIARGVDQNNKSKL
jgi:hypothetical protein